MVGGALEASGVVLVARQGRWEEVKDPRCLDLDLGFQADLLAGLCCRNDPVLHAGTVPFAYLVSDPTTVMALCSPSFRSYHLRY
jgi:hypothetical protein